MSVIVGGGALRGAAGHTAGQGAPAGWLTKSQGASVLEAILPLSTGVAS